MARHRASGSRQQSSFFSSLSPTAQDALCVGVLFVITLVLFRGIVFDNAAFSSGGDTAAALSYQHAGETIKEKEGIEPLWMPYFFSGMPTFGNVAYIPHNVSYVQTFLIAVLKVFYLNATWSWLVVFTLLGGVFMFFLMRLWSASRVAGLFAAITFMMSPFGIGLAGEGHGSKLMALSYLPMIFLLTHLVFEKRNLLSFGLLSAGFGTLLLTNHMQIVYYVLMVTGFYLVYHIVMDFKSEKKQALSKIVLFAGALVIGLCISSYIYLSVYEYAQFSIRGGGTEGSTGGLSWEYATNWSWHPQELITLLIPAFFGFQGQYYWGTMPFTNSSVYIGLLPLVLAVFSIVYQRTRITVFLVVLAVIVFLMSFGKHFSLLYGLMFDFLPFFNKFRVPVMVLHLLPFIFGVLGAFGLEYLLDRLSELKEQALARLKQSLKITLYAAIGLLLIGFVAKSAITGMVSMEAEDEMAQYQAQYGQQAVQIMSQLKSERENRLSADFTKFALLMTVSLGLIVLYVNKSVSRTVFAGGMLAILFIDLFLVIKAGKFIDPKPGASLTQSFQPDQTINFLKQQPGIFRVYPVAAPYSDNTFAYHGIQSVGGYSPAKLKIYQEMVDSAGLHPPRLPLKMSIINMLNAKYLVVPGRLPDDMGMEMVNVDQTKQLITYHNPAHLPRAWFVTEHRVASSNAEKFSILLSPSFDARKTAVLEEEPAARPESSDSTSVELVSHGAHRVALKAFSDRQSLLVLSEIYYPAGWKAFVDEAETRIYRTNSILRSIVVPAGSHEVEFRFEPAYPGIGYMLSHVGWGIAGIMIVAGVWRTPSIRQRIRRKLPEREHEAG